MLCVRARAVRVAHQLVRRIARSTLMMKQREDTAQGKVSLGVRGGVCLTLAAWVLWDGMAVTLEQRDPLFISGRVDTP